jgi:glycerol-1-phosphate dehydrogenase [NAD(P)+]
MHGEQCGVGSIMMAYLYNANWKRIQATLKRLGAPTTAKELGVSDEDAVKALEASATIRPDRYTILQKLNMDYKECERVAKATGVIT